MIKSVISGVIRGVISNVVGGIVHDRDWETLLIIF